MKHTLLLSVVLSSLVFPNFGFASSAPEGQHPPDNTQDQKPTQFQLGTLPPIDVGMAVSGSSQKFMRFDRIANKLQKAGQSVENGQSEEQAKRDARLNGRDDSLDVDPVRAPSEGRANQQGHKALGVALQTNF